MFTVFQGGVWAQGPCGSRLRDRLFSCQFEISPSTPFVAMCLPDLGRSRAAELGSLDSIMPKRHEPIMAQESRWQKGLCET